MYLHYVKVRWWCSSERLVGKYVDCPFDNKITTHPYGTNAYKDMIADMINNKKLNSIVTELFIRGRKLNISLVFITQSYFKVPKDVRQANSFFYH